LGEVPLTHDWTSAVTLHCLQTFTAALTVAEAATAGSKSPPAVVQEFTPS
jgi:hypothetical protein